MSAGPARTATLDALLAFKAIALSEQLIGNQKRVAATLLDHFNRKSGRCDPSLDTIAALLGISRRTVIRTIARLEQIGFFHKVRHGGHYHCNHYEPVWSRFREHEAEWKLKRLSRKDSREQRLSLSQGNTRHRAGVEAVTQTFPTNQSEETFAGERSMVDSRKEQSPIEDKRLGKKQNDKTLGSLSSTFHVKRIRSRDAAHDAAERRWCSALNIRYSNNPGLYARIIEAIDAQLHQQATLAEMAMPGSGLTHILNRMSEQPWMSMPAGGRGV
jgi:biotin operon repressor